MELVNKQSACGVCKQSACGVCKQTECMWSCQTAREGWVSLSQVTLLEASSSLIYHMDDYVRRAGDLIEKESSPLP